MVKEIKEQAVVVENQKKERVEIPFGVLVWAAVSFWKHHAAPCLSCSCCSQGERWQKFDPQPNGQDWGSTI